MFFASWLTPAGRCALAGAVALLACGAANAQNSSLPESGTVAVSSAQSSSSDFTFLGGSGNAAEPAAPAPAGGGGQYDNNGGGSHGWKSKLTFEAGAGFNAPIGNDTPYITWGGNFTLGGGLRFSHGFSLLGEYQFIDDKLPGAFIAAGGGQTGDAHINSITVSPVIELMPKLKNTLYLVGGGGWYHKSTNFNIQECCDFYGYPVTVTANSFTSNQLGGNIGFGYEHRLAGMYGDGTTRLFAEARYLYIRTPQINENNGLGRTELIPVTFGVRF